MKSGPFGTCRAFRESGSADLRLRPVCNRRAHGRLERTRRIEKTNVLPGTYSLSESSSVTGYDASDWICSRGTLVGSQVTVGLGDNVVCTTTNDDGLKLVKVVNQ